MEAIKPESGSGSTGIRAGVQPESEGVQPYFSSKEAVKPEPTPEHYKDNLRLENDRVTYYILNG